MATKVRGQTRTSSLPGFVRHSLAGSHRDACRRQISVPECRRASTPEGVSLGAFVATARCRVVHDSPRQGCPEGGRAEFRFRPWPGMRDAAVLGSRGMRELQTRCGAFRRLRRLRSDVPPCRLCVPRLQRGRAIPRLLSRVAGLLPYSGRHLPLARWAAAARCCRCGADCGSWCCCKRSTWGVFSRGGRCGGCPARSHTALPHCSAARNRGAPHAAGPAGRCACVLRGAVTASQARRALPARPGFTARADDAWQTGSQPASPSLATASF